MADPFVLMCKTAILAMRSARWRWQWAQREMQSGDEMSGMQHPEFQQLVRDIYEFQYVYLSTFLSIPCHMCCRHKEDAQQADNQSDNAASHQEHL